MTIPDRLGGTRGFMLRLQRELTVAGVNGEGVSVQIFRSEVEKRTTIRVSMRVKGKPVGMESYFLDDVDTADDLEADATKLVDKIVAKYRPESARDGILTMPYRPSVVVAWECKFCGREIGELPCPGCGTRVK
jgi:hypothetical protein